MKLLHDKMKELDANQMATGHFAKLFHNETHGSVFIHSSNDEEHDQSGLLSRLPHEILNSIVLPLSDLTKQEVIKLAENFGLTDEGKALKIHQCLKQDPELSELIAKKVPRKMVKPGEITNLEQNENLGEHTGIHQHTFGEEFEYRNGTKLITGNLGQYSFSEKKMFIVDSNYFRRQNLQLIKCRLSEEVHWLEPVKGFLGVSQNNFVECWIFPKTLSSVFIELTEAIQLLPGDIVTVFKKKGKNSKVYLTGEICLLALDPEPIEGEASVPKVNHVLNF